MNKTWKVVLAFIVVFVAGAAFGGVLTLSLGRLMATRLQPRPQAFGAQLMMQWMRSGQLDLTPEQREKVRPIVASTTEELRRLRREDAHNAQLLIERMQDQIGAILTPEQRNRFILMIQRQRERMQRFMQEQQRKRDPASP